MERFVTMHASRDGGRETAESAGMAGFYLGHNAGIGLLAFAGGVLLGLGTLLVLISNAITIGLVFGYLVTTHARGPFLDFVTAHAPLELSAVVLCGAAGLRLGWSVVLAGERSRLVALREGGRQALPIAVTAVVLFFLAGCVEGFVSPADIPWSVKLAVATSTGLLLIHWIASGHPVFRTRRRRSRSGQEAP